MLNRVLSLIGFDRFTFGAIRSSKWPEIRKQFLKENPLCAVCGKKGKLLSPLEVHHIIPYSVDPSKELEENNLVTTCSKCHLFVAHLNSWKSYNKDVRMDSEIWNQKILNRP